MVHGKFHVGEDIFSTINQVVLDVERARDWVFIENEFSDSEGVLEVVLVPVNLAYVKVKKESLVLFFGIFEKSFAGLILEIKFVPLNNRFMRTQHTLPHILRLG